MGKSNNIKYILIIISIILTLACVGLFFSMQNNNNLNKNTIINVSEETNLTLKAEIKDLYPGKTEDYVISFVGNNAEDYFITLNFNGANDGKLKNYIKVEIKTENSVINKTLLELLNGELISLGKGVKEINISYTMPVDVGNEAQGTTISFNVEIEAKVSE
ncbi:MAG: hypothetical protein IKW33_02700 [Clostridia bacterium]|nr:hypothetical protein [Clostridia bacterium]